tara:strand:+ start:407 stop:565 length:159 start_codon:yes stop_codon:yes gene_type:complete
MWKKISLIIYLLASLFGWYSVFSDNNSWLKLIDLIIGISFGCLFIKEIKKKL